MQTTPDPTDDQEEYENADTKQKSRRKRKRVSPAAEESANASASVSSTNNSTVSGEQPLAVSLEDTSLYLRFAHPQFLKSFVANIAAVLKECEFDVAETTGESGGDGDTKEKFQGLSIHSVDSKVICMISGRLSCEVRKKSVKSDTFCVRLNTLQTILKSFSSKCYLDMYRKQNEADLRLVVHDPLDAQRHRLAFRLPTADVDSNDKCCRQAWQTSYTIYMVLSILQQLVKVANELNADEMIFKIYEKKQQSTQENRNTAVRDIVFVLSASGDCEITRSFHSRTAERPATDEKKSSTVPSTIVTIDEGNDCGPFSNTLNRSETGEQWPSLLLGEYNCVYNQGYAITYLARIFKNMECRSVELRLEDSKPLIIRYSIGSDSYLEFCLAQMTSNEETG